MGWPMADFGDGVFGANDTHTAIFEQLSFSESLVRIVAAQYAVPYDSSRTAAWFIQT
jgi:hypothetical protein